MSLFKTRACSLLISLFAFVQLSHAAELRSARVTQIINDVKLLPGQAAARTAVVNESVSTGTAVRTGADSRTELTFLDLTITRLGANTIFSFNGAARQIDLGSGAVLVQEAGGQLSNVDGSAYDPYTADAVASNGWLHPVLLDAFRHGP